jgi:hypothetical protein
MSVTRNIATKLTLEGEAQFRSEMDSVSNSMRNLKSQMALVTSEFDGNANSVSALSAKQNILKKEADEQKQKIAALNSAIEESTLLYGEENNVTAEFRTRLNYAKADLNKLNGELSENEKYLNEAKTSANGCATSIDEYGKKVKAAGEASETFGNESTGAVNALAEALAAAGIVATVGKIEKALLSCATGAASFADEVLTTSAQTGIATEKLQGYMYAAELVDVPVNTLTDSMAKQIKSMGSYNDGTTSIVDAYKQLGVEVTNTDGSLRDSQDVYWEVISALSGMENSTERDELSMTLLGKSAQDLNPLILAGADAMNELADEAQQAGYIMSEETLKAMGALDDQIQKMNNNSEALKNTIGAALAPALTDMAEAGNNVLQAATNYAAQNPDTIKALTAVTSAAGGATAALTAYKVAAKAMSAAGLSLASLGAVAGYAAIFGAAVFAIVSTVDQMNHLVEKTDDLTYAQQQLDDATQNLTNVQTQYGDAVWDSGSEAAEAYDFARIAVAEAQNQVDALTASQDAAGASTDDLASRQAAMAGAMDTWSSAVTGLMTSYQAAYTAAYDSINGQMGLFDTISVTVGTDVNQMITALQSQEDYMNTYAENIKKAAQMGLSDGLIKELSDGSVESAAYLQAIVDAGEEKIPELNEAFGKVQEGKDTFASAVAEAETDFSEKMDDITQDAADAVGDLDLYDEAATSAKNTMDGYLAGLDEQSGALYTKMSAIAEAALSAFNAPLGIASPSKEFGKSAGYSMDGYEDEIERRSSGLNNLMGNVGSAALSSFASAQVKSGSTALFAAKLQTPTQAGGIPERALNSFAGAINELSAAQNGQAVSGDLTLIMKLPDGTEAARAWLPDFRRAAAASPELGG